MQCIFIRLATILSLSICFSLIFYPAYTQTQSNAFEANVCPNETSSEFFPDEPKAPESRDKCNSGTRISYNYTGDVDIVSSIETKREDDGPHRVRLKVNWAALGQGVVTINVYYERMWTCEFCLPNDCKFEDKKLLYSYKITKLRISPGGQLSGNNVSTATDSQHTITFNLTYSPSDDYIERVKRIRYWNGVQTVEQKVSSVTNSASLTYYATGFGTHVITTSIQNSCDEWLDGPSKNVTVYPTCYQDNQANVSLSVSGPGLTSPGEYLSGYPVEKDALYTINTSGITDFSSHYDWVLADGGQDIVFTGNTFSVLKGLGSYRIEAVKKAGREACITLPSIKIFAGGKDVTLEQVCPIILPRDLPDLGYPINPDDIILQHFAATVKSKRSITVMPGITLTLGAELILIQTEPLPQPGDADLAMNFIQQTSFDDYGRVIGESRSYFDDREEDCKASIKT